MANQSVVVKVAGAPQPVVFDSALQAFTATIPVQASAYQTEIDAVDVGGSLVIALDFATVGPNQVVTVTVTDAQAQPVPGLATVAYYQNPVGHTDFGAADSETTDAAGRAQLYLVAASYNLRITIAGFATVVLKNFQVLAGIVPFTNTGGTIPEQHVLRDNNGVVLGSAMVKVFDNSLALAASFVACAVTGVDGSWSIPFVQDRAYTLIFEKAGYDLAKAVV